MWNLVFHEGIWPVSFNMNLCIRSLWYDRIPHFNKRKFKWIFVLVILKTLKWTLTPLEELSFSHWKSPIKLTKEITQVRKFNAIMIIVHLACVLQGQTVKQASGRNVLTIICDWVRRKCRSGFFLCQNKLGILVWDQPPIFNWSGLVWLLVSPKNRVSTRRNKIWDHSKFKARAMEFLKKFPKRSIQ